MWKERTKIRSYKKGMYFKVNSIGEYYQLIKPIDEVQFNTILPLRDQRGIIHLYPHHRLTLFPQLYDNVIFQEKAIIPLGYGEGEKAILTKNNENDLIFVYENGRIEGTGLAHTFENRYQEQAYLPFQIISWFSVRKIKK